MSLRNLTLRASVLSKWACSRSFCLLFWSFSWVSNKVCSSGGSTGVCNGYIIDFAPVDWASFIGDISLPSITDLLTAFGSPDEETVPPWSAFLSPSEFIV